MLSNPLDKQIYSQTPSRKLQNIKVEYLPNIPNIHKLRHSGNDS